MNPVRGFAMLRFLEWLTQYHPEIASLEELEEADLLGLANRFEHGKLNGNDVLRAKWRAGFDFLLHNDDDWEGYGPARDFLRESGLTDRDAAHQMMDEAIRLGARPKQRSSDGRVFDILRRYKSIPLHAVVLYSSEDSGVQSYLLRNWGALDSLSGEFCDIYPSLGQLRSIEDVYDLLDEPATMEMASAVPVSDLPGLFFWDHVGGAEFVPFGDVDSLKQVLRIIFGHIRQRPTIDAVRSAKRELLAGILRTRYGPANTHASILFLAANPHDTSRLALDEEVRAIMQKVRAAEHRESLEFLSCWAVRPDDLLQYMNQYRPHVVHFSGHGDRSGRIILSDESGASRAVSPEALYAMFSTLRDNVVVVVLNACYSKRQAEAISRAVGCVIGMNSAIGDNSARVFSGSFYRALGFGRTVSEAFDQARAALLLEGASDADVPQLVVSEGADIDRRLV